MSYLLNYDFSNEEIEEFCANVPPMLVEQLFNSYRLVSKNLDALKEMGIKNYKELFLKFYDMFLMDNSNFLNIFNKYDPKDLIDKINDNIDIVEFL